MLLKKLQHSSSFLVGWVLRAQHTLLCGQRGRQQGHGLRCLALAAQRNAEYAGYAEACRVVGPQRTLGLG